MKLIDPEGKAESCSLIRVSSITGLEPHILEWVVLAKHLILHLVEGLWVSLTFFVPMARISVADRKCKNQHVRVRR